jgi:ADP-ribose pyrophosphatase YjhB (NUDIX family)
MAREYPDHPIVGVGVVVLQGDKVLLVRRGQAPNKGRWSLPGGGQELGETHREAARREVREETAVEIEVHGLIDVVDSITRDDAGRIRFHYVLVDVLAVWRAGEARAGGDAAEARWFALDALGALGLWSETLRVIRRGYDMERGVITGWDAGTLTARGTR